MIKLHRMASAAIALGLSAAAAAAAELPPIPANLLNTAAVVCIRIDVQGAISGAFVVTSTGSADKDAEVVTWARQLRWDPAKPGDRSRDTWFPMPVLFGKAAMPTAPATCAPPPDAPPATR